MIEAVQESILSSEAARICGVSVATIHLWERTGQIMAKRTSNGVRLFDRDEIEGFARERDRRRAVAASARSSS